MATFQVDSTLPFDVPNGQPFYADPAAVFVKTGDTVLAHPSHPAPFEKHSTSGLVHPPAVSSFTKLASMSPLMERSRNAAG
jgi:hypothetical protein